MGLAMGLLSAGHALGAATGVFLAARIFDWSAKYDWVWLAAFGLAILAGLMAFAIRENRQERPDSCDRLIPRFRGFP